MHLAARVINDMNYRMTPLVQRIGDKPPVARGIVQLRTHERDAFRRGILLHAPQPLLKFRRGHVLTVPALPVAAKPCEVMVLDPMLLEAGFQLLAVEVGVSRRGEPSDIHHVLDLVRSEHVQEFAHAPRTRPDRPDLHLSVAPHEERAEW